MWSIYIQQKAKFGGSTKTATDEGNGKDGDGNGSHGIKEGETERRNSSFEVKEGEINQWTINYLISEFIGVCFLLR